MDEGYLESVFWGHNVLYINSGAIFLQVDERYKIIEEALILMMKEIDIKNYYMIPARFDWCTRTQTDVLNIMMIKFEDPADEAFFKLRFSDALYIWHGKIINV